MNMINSWLTCTVHVRIQYRDVWLQECSARRCGTGYYITPLRVAIWLALHSWPAAAAQVAYRHDTRPFLLKWRVWPARLSQRLIGRSHLSFIHGLWVSAHALWSWEQALRRHGNNFRLFNYHNLYTTFFEMYSATTRLFGNSLYRKSLFVVCDVPWEVAGISLCRLRWVFVRFLAS